MAKQKINKNNEVKVNRANKPKKNRANVVLSIITCLLLVTMIGGISAYFVNNNKPSNPPAVEQGQGQESKILNFNAKDYSVTKEEFMNAGGLPGFRLDASLVEESVDYKIPFNICFIDKLTHQLILSIDSLIISLHKVNDSSLGFGNEPYIMFLNLDSLLKSNNINISYCTSGIQQLSSFTDYDIYSGFCNCKGLNAEGNYFVFLLSIQNCTIQDIDFINVYYEIDF